MAGLGLWRLRLAQVTSETRVHRQVFFSKGVKFNSHDTTFDIYSSRNISMSTQSAHEKFRLVRTACLVCALTTARERRQREVISALRFANAVFSHTFHELSRLMRRKCGQNFSFIGFLVCLGRKGRYVRCTVAGWLISSLVSGGKSKCHSPYTVACIRQ